MEGQMKCGQEGGAGGALSVQGCKMKRHKRERL